MANNFVNRVKANISAEESLPTEVYYHATKKAICIELDAANKSSAGVTVGVSVEDTSALTGSGISVTVSTAADGIFTSAGHNLSVNDRLLFAGSVPTIVSGSAGGDASLSATRYYFVQSVTTDTFTISETRSATTPIKFSNTGSGLTYKVVAIADIVRGAPIPVGGSLKVISGQKLVLEATDRIFAHCSSAKNVDVICSMLEDVS